MDNLRGIETFVKAVEAGSIAGAARALGISAAAASQNIARLELQLDSRLLNRSTRRMALTDAGALYYARVSTLISDLELAGQAVLALNSQPQGKLCIASTAAFARYVVAPLLPAFTALYPRIAVELLATDSTIDHQKEAVDISIRIDQQLEDGMVAVRLANVPARFCAAPSYIERAGVPAGPEDLSRHDCLVFRYPADGRFLRWGFIRNGEHIQADPRATIVSNDIDVLARLAVAGAGITRLAAFVADPFLATGELVELFQPESAGMQAELDPLLLYLCVRDRYELTPKVKSFFDYIKAAVPQQWRV